MYEEYHLKTYPNGYKTKITYYELEENPRTWDNIGEIHIMRQNHLGDFLGTNDESYGDRDELIEVIEKLEKDMAIILPIYLYQHGCVKMRTEGNGDWDTSHIGFIVATRESIRKAYHVKRISDKRWNMALAELKAEIEYLSDWMNGEIYDIILYDPADNKVEEEFPFIVFGRDLNTDLTDQRIEYTIRLNLKYKVENEIVKNFTNILNNGLVRLERDK